MAPMRNLDGGISAPTPLGNADFLNLHEYHGQWLPRSSRYNRCTVISLCCNPRLVIFATVLALALDDVKCIYCRMFSGFYHLTITTLRTLLARFAMSPLPFRYIRRTRHCLPSVFSCTENPGAFVWLVSRRFSSTRTFLVVLASFGSCMKDPLSFMAAKRLN